MSFTYYDHDETVGKMRMADVGRWVDPVNPDQADIRIEDIARALSKLCRFGGHIAGAGIYCPAEDQRILTSDLRWVPAGDLVLGDRLYGFDEHPVTSAEDGAKGRRNIRPATVTHAERVKRPMVRLEMDDGSTIRASAEHPWLTRTFQSGNTTWRTGAEIAADLGAGRRRFINRTLMPWRADITRDGGWLAGMFDGEGCISIERTGTQVSIAQNPGRVLDEAARLMSGFGFQHSTLPNRHNGVVNLQLRGGWTEALRLLGTLRPMRLIDKLEDALLAGRFSKNLRTTNGLLEIVKAWLEPDEWVAGLETSTRTYICEGFGAHNSVAEHSLHVAAQLYRQHGDHTLALCGLMHDATEAYLGDVIRPVKRNLPEYRVIEDRLHEVIAERFGLPNDAEMMELPPSDGWPGGSMARIWGLVKQADEAILPWEMAMVRDCPWRTPTPPEVVEVAFRAAFKRHARGAHPPRYVTVSPGLVTDPDASWLQLQQQEAQR